MQDATFFNMTPFTVASPLGDVQGKLYGRPMPNVPNGYNYVYCIQGKSPNSDVITEWVKTAKALAADGWCVILPDLHTNPNTAPGTISSAVRL